MKSVLIPVDFSEGTFNSCKYVIENVPKNIAVSIWLFHVYADQLMFQPTMDLEGYMVDPMLDLQLYEELKEIAEKNLSDLEKEVVDYINDKGYGNITVKKVLIQGDPEWTLNNICEEVTPDVIVMATKGKGSKDHLEGNMAKKIMGKAKVPVLAVPSDYKKYFINKVLYVTHLESEQEDIKSINMLFDKLAHLKIGVTVVYFMDDHDDEVEIKHLMDEYHDMVIENRFNIQLLKKEEKIADIVTGLETDLIAFVAHKVNPLKIIFNRVISKKDLFATGMPVLGLPQIKER